MIHSRREEMFRRWGLTDNPFITLPPEDEAGRKRVFTGREAEITQICSLIKRPRGLFVCGMFGVGKTLLVQESLRRVREKGVIEVYSIFNSQDGFCKTVLKSLSKRIAEMGNGEAKLVYEVLTKGKKSVSRRIQGGGEAKLDIGLAKAGIDALREEVESITMEIENPRDAIEKLITTVIKEKKKSIVIAVDDLERRGDITSIQEIIDDTRDIITFGSSLILTGHPIGVTRDLRTSSGGILIEIPLEQLSKEELVEMMIKYLNTARKEDKGTYPFHIDAAKYIAEQLFSHQLTPRLFNLACFHLLEKAAIKGYQLIDEEMLKKDWSVIAEELVKNIEERDREYIKILYRLGAIGEDSEEAIIEIGGDLAEYEEVRNKLAHLIHRDILIEREIDQKRVIDINPLIKENFPAEFFSQTEKEGKANGNSLSGCISI